MDGIKILIVEDEAIVARNIENRLTKAGYIITGISASGKDALKKASTTKPDLILMDVNLKGEMDGVETAKIIRKTLRLPIIFLTSFTDEETFQRAKTTEPFGYIIKPFDIKELNRNVEMALYKNKVDNEIFEIQKRYEIAVEAGNTGVWEFWPTEDKYFSDKNLKTLYGFNEDELSDNLADWSALVYKDDRPLMTEKFKEFLKSNSKEFRFEHRIYRKDGSVGWVVDYGLLLEADDSKPLRLIGTTTDITDRKNSEITLKKSEEKFRSIFEHAGIGMALITPGGEFFQVNKSLCEMLGYTDNQLVGMNIRDITHPGDLEESISLKQRMLINKNLNRQHTEKRYLSKKGETIWVITTVSLLRDFEGKPLYFISQIQNITERKKAEEKLKKYADELNKLNISKDKFFSIISHDLRSPFNALLGITEYMAQYYKDMSEDEIKKSVSNIYTSSQKLYNLILNLLEWSRIQSGRLEVEKSIINLADLGLEIINLYQEATNNKQIELINNITEDILIYADKYMIDTIMRNFVSNGIKFTHAGGKITIDAVINGDNAEVSVTDNGIGISQKNQINLFRIDEQYTREGTAKEKGTGLGLILCKEFIEKNGGFCGWRAKKAKEAGFLLPYHVTSERSDYSHQALT
jgi:PAS domain S-box-containing protein